VKLPQVIKSNELTSVCNNDGKIQLNQSASNGNIDKTT